MTKVTVACALTKPDPSETQPGWNPAPSKKQSAAKSSTHRYSPSLPTHSHLALPFLPVPIDFACHFRAPGSSSPLCCSVPSQTLATRYQIRLAGILPTQYSYTVHYYLTPLRSPPCGIGHATIWPCLPSFPPAPKHIPPPPPPLRYLPAVPQRWAFCTTPEHFPRRAHLLANTTLSYILRLPVQP
ncbi:uncharacterized protein EI97DRAFT_114297 [Westerdykella ornata]|uniref:Uncharacterized protein n=1 Tax=Westerdykella ornata TaxID=318751 RepID=A0A6A6JVR0_WESOR|nr:uncharacterized protein EI97DRAFT_114297 [Westerdykella ornata]KAF2280193.1 hypothetical protein EI97DRAFT_114297 [Westerdykella ornata]